MGVYNSLLYSFFLGMFEHLYNEMLKNAKAECEGFGEETLAACVGAQRVEPPLHSLNSRDGVKMPDLGETVSRDIGEVTTVLTPWEEFEFI